MSNVPIGSAESAFTSTSTDVLEAYNRQSCMYDAKINFHKILDDLSSPATMSRLRDAKIGIIRTIEAFEREHTRSYVVFQLAMSMSPRAFRSVLSGTIAWEASRTAKTTWYHANGPGVYAVGVAVDGRGGRFLTAREIEDLARGVDKYASGYQALQVPTSQRTSSQQGDIMHLRTIDNAIALFNHSLKASRSIANPDELRRVVMFAERLRERAKIILSVDPAGTTIQIQSPLYVGCSDKLEVRTLDYETPALSKINKLLCLTLNILNVMRLPSKLVVRPIIRIWEPHQLPYAERLVATLAESLVAQNGFNATEAGGKVSKVTSLTNPLSLRIARRDVLVNKPFFRQHMASVKSYLDEGAGFVNDVHGLSYSFSRLKAETSKLDEQLDSFAADESWKWEDACQLLERRQKLSEKRINANFNVRVRLQICQTLLKSMLQESLGRSLRPSERDFIPGTYDEMDVD